MEFVLEAIKLMWPMWTKTKKIYRMSFITCLWQTKNYNTVLNPPTLFLVFVLIILSPASIQSPLYKRLLLMQCRDCTTDDSSLN